MKYSIILLTVMLTVGCDSSDNIKCYEGTVMNYNCCSGVSMISLTKYVPGSKTVVINDIQYKHVILVPGAFEDQHLYLTLRRYNQDKDQHLLHGLCLCLIGTDDVPNYVVTSGSTSECP